MNAVTLKEYEAQLAAFEKRRNRSAFDEAVYQAMATKVAVARQKLNAARNKTTTVQSSPASASSSSTQQGPLGLTSFATSLATLSNPYS